MIEHYRFGKIVIDGVSYKRDVIVTPEKVIPDWWRRKGHECCVSDIQDVIEEFQPEVLILGTGQFGMMKVLPETEAYLQEKNVKLESLKTSSACELFNSMSQQARVVGAFHLTC